MRGPHVGYRSTFSYNAFALGVGFESYPGEHKTFRGSSVVERSAVNRLVGGSNPLLGVRILKTLLASSFESFFMFVVLGIIAANLIQLLM